MLFTLTHNILPFKVIIVPLTVLDISLSQTFLLASLLAYICLSAFKRILSTDEEFGQKEFTCLIYI